MASSTTQICFFLLLLLILQLNLSFGHDAHHSASSESPSHHHHCGHDHNHDHHVHDYQIVKERKLPEELAEEEDLKLYGYGSHHAHDHDHHHDAASDLSAIGLWINAMGCSLLVSLCSLICLILLPIIFIQGKPSKTIVDSLAVFGAGAMLGDAFLHQLPHAFGGDHSHSHDVPDNHHHEHSHSHSHSLKDLSVGLSVLAGIVLFLIVEKVVRYVDEMSGGANPHGHHHHHHSSNIKKLKGDDDIHDNLQSDENDKSIDEKVIREKEPSDTAVLRKRSSSTGTEEDKPKLDAANGSKDDSKSVAEQERDHSSSTLVFGYLNLFSDGVHNFTDGMALGSAFLLYGSVGGWSRTLFLLAHELPQEIGDFGILVRSGFSVSKALFFNFLSALVALAGTALALMWGQDPGQSSLIEGFTAGGFIYIAVAGVLAEMNNGSCSLRSTATQLTSLIMGMAVALCISLFE